MKKLIPVIVILFSLTSCMKQASDQLAPETKNIAAPSNLKEYTEVLLNDSTLLQSASNQTARLSRDLYVHVSALSATNASWGCKGISYTVEAKKMKMQGAYTKSNWVAMKGSGVIAGVQRDIFVQGGLMSLTSNSIDIAFQIWDLKTRSLISGTDLNLQYTGNTVIITDGMIVTFKFIQVEGTRWAFIVNDVILFTADFGFDTACNFPPEVGSKNSIEFATESRGGDDFNPKLHIFSIQYLKDGVWNVVPQARFSVSVINAPYNTNINIWPIVRGLNTSECYAGGSGTAPDVGALIW